MRRWLPGRQSTSGSKCVSGCEFVLSLCVCVCVWKKTPALSNTVGYSGTSVSCTLLAAAKLMKKKTKSRVLMQLLSWQAAVNLLMRWKQGKKVHTPKFAASIHVSWMPLNLKGVFRERERWGWNWMVRQAGSLIGWLDDWFVGGWVGGSARNVQQSVGIRPTKGLSSACLWVSMRLPSSYFVAALADADAPHPHTHNQRCFVRGRVKKVKKNLLCGSTGGGLIRRDHAATLGEIHQNPQHWGQELHIIFIIVISLVDSKLCSVNKEILVCYWTVFTFSPSGSGTFLIWCWLIKRQRRSMSNVSSV